MTRDEGVTAMTNASPTGPRPQTSRLRRACVNCAKVKEKCVPLDDASIIKCQRCHRLRKDCIFPNAPLRKRQRVSTADSQNAASSAYPTPVPSESSGLWAAVACREPLPTNLWYEPNNPGRDGRPVSETLADLPASKKEILFNEFLADLNPYFPFLVLDESCKDALSCEQNAPFTFAACIAASMHRQPPLQRQLGRDILGFLGETMFLNGKKSMDLLQGLNILIAWYMFHIQRNPQLMNFVFLVNALLVDLGLKISRTSSYPFATMTDLPKIMHGPGIDSDNHGLGGIRALLTNWYINAQIAICYRRLEYPRWSVHLEECLQKLQAASPSPSDLQAIQVLRLYQTMERYLCVDGIRPSSSLPIRAHVRCFRDDLQRIRSTPPLFIATNQHFELHLQSVEIALYDSVISTPCDHPAQMLEALHALLARVNTYFDLFLSQPSEAFPLFSFLHMSQASFAIDVLAKLSFFQFEGWDLTYIRTSHPFNSIIERTMDKFEEVYISERTRFPDHDTSRFAVYPMKLRQCKKWYEEKVASEAKEALEQARNAAAANVAGIGGSTSGVADFDLAGQFPDVFGDQGWWTYDGRFDVQ